MAAHCPQGHICKHSKQHELKGKGKDRESLLVQGQLRGRTHCWHGMSLQQACATAFPANPRPGLQAPLAALKIQTLTPSAGQTESHVSPCGTRGHDFSVGF